MLMKLLLIQKREISMISMVKRVLEMGHKHQDLEIFSISLAWEAVEVELKRRNKLNQLDRSLK